MTRRTLGYLQATAVQISAGGSLAAEAWQAQVRHYQPLVERIIAQSERRVLHGEAVPAQEKLVSLFETHADIILKGSREPCYGHKLNLTSGRSGLILDLVIEAGNPADSERFLPMLDRHIAIYGGAPRQAAADGAYATRDNLAQAKARGVADVAFHKKRGLTIEDMVKSHWVYRRLRNFRAGIEAVSPASSAPMAWPAPLGAASSTSRHTSGLRSSPTTSPSWPASGRRSGSTPRDRARAPGTPRARNRARDAPHRGDLLAVGHEYSPTRGQDTFVAFCEAQDIQIKSTDAATFAPLWTGTS